MSFWPHCFSFARISKAIERDPAFIPVYYLAGNVHSAVATRQGVSHEWRFQQRVTCVLAGRNRRIGRAFPGRRFACRGCATQPLWGWGGGLRTSLGRVRRAGFSTAQGIRQRRRPPEATGRRAPAVAREGASHVAADLAPLWFRRVKQKQALLRSNLPMDNWMRATKRRRPTPGRARSSRANRADPVSEPSHGSKGFPNGAQKQP
jgi:hypothetical protein